MAENREDPIKRLERGVEAVAKKQKKFLPPKKKQFFGTGSFLAAVKKRKSLLEEIK